MTEPGVLRFCRNIGLAGIYALVATIQFGAGRLLAVSLEDCVVTAMKENPGVRAAVERVHEAREGMRQARSAYFPMLDARASVARSDNPAQAFMMLLNQRSFSMETDFNNPPDTDNLALGLGAQFILLDFGRRSNDLKMAREGEHLSRLVLRGLQNELIHQVTAGYFSVLQAAAFITVQEESVETLAESLRVARERLQAGGAVQSDVLNLEVQLSQAGDETIRARNGLQLAMAALNAAIGQDLISTGNMPDEITELEQCPVGGEDEDVLLKRPEYLAACGMAKLQSYGLSKARWEYAPTVSAFGSYDWNREVSGGSFEDSYMVGIQAQITLFDGFRRSGAIEQAAARMRAAQAEADKALSQLRLDLTSASLKAVEAWERLETARRSIKSAEEALRITRERYQGGAADLPELLTAQVGLTGTRTRNVAALYDYLTAMSNLERARGNLIECYDVRNISEE